MMLTEFLSVLRLDDSEDPITGFLTHDWASVGGWSMFVALAILIVIGAFRETWIPGRRYRRLEQSAEKLSDANDELTKQNGQLITANEITKYFFQETVPKRRDNLEDTSPHQRGNTFGYDDTFPKVRPSSVQEQTAPRHALPASSEESAPNRWEPQ